MGVLGSREQMCIHDDVKLLQGRVQNNACLYVRKKKFCRHHSSASDFVKRHPKLGNEPFDIEDLVNIGRTKGPCPYYVSRELHRVVDILFAPYNYLIDSGKRDSLSGIQWDDAVIIFDEAHNLESICADAASFDLPSSYLTTCISEAIQCISLCIKKRTIEKSADKEHDPDNYAILKALLLKLEKRINELTIDSKELGFTRPGPYIYEFLADLNITFETASMLMNTIDGAAELLEERDMSLSVDGRKGAVCRLQSIKDILKIIFRDGGKTHAKFYRFHVQEPRHSGADTTKGKVSRTLSWWCFNPGIAMKEFESLHVRSIILTSGTLSPLDSFALELNLDLPVRLENPHVISSAQVWVGVLPSGPSGCYFNSSFRNRDSIEYKQELGNAIVNFARIVPDGLLVFFPSYYVMEQCIECWMKMTHVSSTDFNTIWDRICKNKQPVVEPKQSSNFGAAIEDFQAKLRDKSTSGAIFFAVCRGKVSEGLDFADQAGRAVVVTGMPFSTMTDPKIRLKREFLDQQAMSQKDQKALTGEEWYVQQAARAVNQAVGRVIRHRYDYGAIIFCDERFAQQSRQNQMSFWLRPHVKTYTRFGDVVFTLSRFFRGQISCSQSKPKIEKPSPDITCGEMMGQTQDIMISSPEEETITVGADGIRKSMSSTLAAATGLFFDSPEVLPANRSTLSSITNDRILMKSRDCKRLHSVDHKSKDPEEQDYEVVDLTGDRTPLRNQDIIKGMVVPCSSKHRRTSEIASPDSGCDLSLKTWNSGCLPGTSSISCTSKALELSSSEPKEHASFVGSKSCLQSLLNVNVKSGTILTAKRSDKEPLEKANALSMTNEQTRGSAFLFQVQEKLTPAEYREFVGLMKALKSKAMKILPVLESIAKLFSAPERLCLLHGFKDYVPAKFRPYYEQHISALSTTDTFEDTLPKRLS